MQDELEQSQLAAKQLEQNMTVLNVQAAEETKEASRKLEETERVLNETRVNAE